LPGADSQRWRVSPLPAQLNFHLETDVSKTLAHPALLYRQDHHRVRERTRWRALSFTLDLEFIELPVKVPAHGETWFLIE